MKRKVRKQALILALSLSTAFGVTVPGYAASVHMADDPQPAAQTNGGKERKSQWPAAAPAETEEAATDTPQDLQSLLPVTGQDKFLASLGKQQGEALQTEGSRIIVKYKQGADFSASRTASSAVYDALALPGMDLEVLETLPGDMNSVIDSLKNDPNVLYAEPDVKVHMASVPSDPMFPDQWGLRNVGQIIDGPVKGLPGFDINALNAWDISQGTGDIVVAVLDTGVDAAHPDLEANIWRNAGEIPGNGIDDDQDGFVDDVNGWDFYNGDGTVFDASQGDYHGTEVAGIIAASANNGIGISGVAPGVKILPLKVLGPDGTGYASDVIRAIQYAERAGARIANLSWTTDTYSKALKDAIEASPMLFTVAAGNEPKEDFSMKAPRNLDETPVYPGSFRSANMVTVGSVGPDGLFSYFSNYGPKTVDLAAPGIAVLSTEPSRNIGLGAQIDNGMFKAVYNVFGFESIIDSGQRQTAFADAMQFLGTGSEDKPSVLLVQDDMNDIGNPDTLPVYKDLLDAAGYSYDVETVPAGADGPPLEKLAGYSTVIWFTGYGNSSFKPADEENVTAYLNGGGHLLLTGPGSLLRLADTPFMRDTLHLDFVRYEEPEYESWSYALGVAGTIYEGVQYSLTDLGIFSDLETNDPAITKINLEIPVEDYGKNTGTSMAAPYAAGIAALLLSQDPSQDAGMVKARLDLSGKPVASLKTKTANGKMLDAFGALTDDELPGKPLKAGNQGSALDEAGNPDDVYFIHLFAGDTLSVSLAGDTGTDFDLYVYDSSAETIQSSSGLAAYSENEGSSVESIDYQAPETGYYYVNVHSFAGTGAYQLSTTRSETATHGDGSYEDSDPALKFTGAWTTAKDTGYSNGTLKRLNTEGSVSFAFSGSEITWTAYKGPDQGLADVYIDGVKVASPSLYNKWKQMRQVILKQNVSKGSHTLTIKWTGNQEPGSTGTSINVDAFSVGSQEEPNTVKLEENDVNFKFTGSWRKQPNSEFSNGYAMASFQAGDEAVLTFTGTRAVLISGRMIGIHPLIAVTVDDQPETEKVIDLNGDTHTQNTYQVPVFDTGELPDGKHTIRIINVTDFIAIGQLPIVIDALMVTKATKEETTNTTTKLFEDTNANVQFTGIWQWNISPRNSGRSSRYSNQVSSAVEFTFRGSQLNIVGMKGADRGMADVYLDGKLVTPNHIDLYSSTYQFQSLLFHLSGLDDQPHKVKIVNTGLKNAKSTGSYISFDVFQVISDLLEMD